MQIIDLSVLLDEKTPVYPGDPPVRIEPAGVWAKDGYQDHYVSLGTHIGTHMDAPAHMLEGGATLNSFDVTQFVGPGKLIDARQGFDLAKIKAANLQAGDIILFWTDLSKKYHEATYFEDYPALPDDIAQYLVSKKVKFVGFDTCSPDHDEFTAHRTLLAGNVLIVENLCNLDQLEGKTFTVTALPIKLGLDGAPARVIATVSD
jgi:kynurenine formamidase